VTYALPLIGSTERLKWLYMTEDGYLMQTVARNLALGLGMTTADGTLPTNGIQPLATFAHMLIYSAVSGDKLGGLRLVAIYNIVLAAISAWLMCRIVRRLLAYSDSGDPCIASPSAAPFAAPFPATSFAMLAAMAWVVSPAIFEHMTNGLETGTYLAAMLLTIDRYQVWTSDPGDQLTGLQRLSLGLLLGLVFWARNDGVFFIAALLAAHVLLGREAGGGAARRVGDAMAAGMLSLLIAAPWLVHNDVNFGSIVPISGKAEAYKAHVGDNLVQVPAIALEGLSSLIPVPGRWERLLPVAVLCSMALVVLIAIIVRTVGGRHLALRRQALAGVILLTLLGGYYGLFFGAPWFMSRYFSALSVLWWPLVATTLRALLRQWPSRRPGATLAGAFAAVLLPGIGLGIALAPPKWQGDGRMPHRQVVAWVQQHVPDDVWVGASQSGTLGFFHDRTINLDGKVNPDALHWRLARRDIRNYVLTTPIACIADWVGFARWHAPEAPEAFRSAFEVRVESPGDNLAVLCRKDFTPATASSG